MKKPRDEIARLRNILALAYISLVVAIAALVALGTYELSGVRQDRQIIVDSFNNRLNGIQLIPGKDGVSLIGPKGDKGDTVVGRDGKDSTSTNTTVIKEVPIKGDKGDTGEQGTPGMPGKTVFTRTNLLTGEGECRYAGDDKWQPESECT